MNILLINSTSTQLDNSLVEFFIQNEKFTTVTVLHIHPDFHSSNDISNELENSHRLSVFRCNGLAIPELTSLLFSKIVDSKPLSHVLYIEDPSPGQNGNFLSLSLTQLKKRVYNELLIKIHFFQILLREMKLVDPAIQIVIIVPPYAQTNLITNDIERAIIFSSSHMITTSIADEFDLYGITCNGIISNENLLDTLQWFLFEKKRQENCLKIKK